MDRRRRRSCVCIYICISTSRLINKTAEPAAHGDLPEKGEGIQLGK